MKTLMCSLIIMLSVAASAQQNALEYHGPYGFVYCSTASMQSISNSFTMELWVYPMATHEIDVESSTGTAGTAGQHYAIDPDYGYASSQSGAGISVGTNGVSVYERSWNHMPALLVWEAPVSGWTHVAVVFENNTPTLYINGQFVHTGVASTRSAVHPSAKYAGSSSYIGILDEVRIWDMSLTAQQILDRMNVHIDGNDPLWSHCALYLPMNEGTGSSTTDVGPHGFVYNFMSNNYNGVEWTIGRCSTPSCDPTCPFNMESWVCSDPVNYNFTVSCDPPPAYSYTFSGATSGSGSGTGSGSVLNVGLTTVMITAVSQCNTTVCSFNVRMRDFVKPTIACGADINAVYDPALCGAQVSVPLPQAADNCAVVSVLNDFNHTGNASGFYPVGCTSIVWTATDPEGNTSSCTQAVTVVDTEPPVAVCKNATVYLAENGFATLTPEQVNNGSSDDCGISGLSVHPVHLSIENLGQNAATLTVMQNSPQHVQNIPTDGLIGHWTFESGSECTDLTGNCAPLTLYGPATVSGGRLNVDPGGFANADINSWLFNDRNLTLVAYLSLDNLSSTGGSPIGLQGRYDQATDAVVFGDPRASQWGFGYDYFSSTNIQSFQPGFAESETGKLLQVVVTIEDFQNPTGYKHIVGYRNGSRIGETMTSIIGQWEQVVMGARWGMSTSEWRGELDAHIEECMLFNRVLSETEIRAMTLGTASTCTATVTVADNTRPSIEFPSALIVHNDPGACGAVVRFPTAQGDPVLYSTHAYSGTICAYDPATLGELQRIPMHIAGIEGEIISTHGLAMHPLNGTCYAVVRHMVGETPLRSLVKLNPKTGCGTLLGNTGINVSSIAFDNAGILYAIGGVSGPGANKLHTLNLSTGAATWVMDVSAGGGKGFAFNPDDGRFYHIWRDGWEGPYGFERIDPVNHTLTPITLPEAPPDYITSMAYEGNGVFLVNNHGWYRLTTAGVITNLESWTFDWLKGLIINNFPCAVRVSDNGMLTAQQTGGLASGSMFPIGTTTNTFTVTDESNNSAACSFTVTVLDAEPPTASCKAAAIALAEGSITVVPDDVDNGSTDNCAITSRAVSPTTFTCSDIGSHAVSLTVTDAHGNSSSCETTVEVIGEIPVPTIASTPEIPVNPGGDPNTIYLGYGPQSVVLTASGGGSYAWSPASGLSCTDCANPTASPTATTTYTVTATNQYGCTTTASHTINVVDVRCGNNMADVLVCHRCQNAHTVCIGSASVQAHLNHGDYLGECEEIPKGNAATVDSPESIVLEQNVPNPFNPSTVIRYTLPAELAVRLSVIDALGREIAVLDEGARAAGAHSVRWDADIPGRGSVPSGTYFCRLVAMDGIGGTIERVRSMVLLK